MNTMLDQLSKPSRKFWFPRIIILMFVILLEGSCGQQKVLKAFAPLTLQNSEKGIITDFEFDGEIRRSHPVSIVFSSLYEISQGETPETRQLHLNLYPFLSLDVEFDQPERHHTNAYTQSGRVVGDPVSEVLLAVNGDSIAMNIRSTKGVFYVRDNGTYHELFQMKEDYAILDSLDITEENTTPIDAPQATPPQLDILVVYSSAAKNAAGGSGNLLNLIYLAAAEVNQGFSNSGITPRISLVNTVEVGTEPTTYPNGLYCITEKSDCCLDSIHTLRDQNFADIVLYIVNNNTFCGLSWMITKFNEYSEQNAFALVNWRCAANQYGMAREIGHLLGAQMDRSSAGYDQGAFAYSYGYQAPNNSFRTIMAKNCLTSSCPRINYWSNPNISVNGIPTGIDYLAPYAADNRRTINNTAEWVSDFRIPPSPPDQVTILTPENGSVMNTSPVLYAWLPEPDASDYYMIVKLKDTNAVVYEDIINGTSHCSEVLCSISPESNLSPEDYKWQMAGINSIGTGEFSTYNNFYIQLQPPILQLPVNGTVKYTKRPVFQWSRLSDSPVYQIQLLTEAGSVVFSTDLTQGSVCANDICSYTTPVNLSDGDYKWHVRGKKTVYGLWSGYSRFTTTTLPAPQLSSPAQNATLYHLNPIFTWNHVENADSYQVVLTKSSDNSQTIETVNASVICNSAVCTFAPTWPLVYDTYTWKVRSYAENTPGYWSQLRTLLLSRLPAPVLVAPLDQEQVIDAQPVFLWQKRTDSLIDGYELQIKDNITNNLITSLFVNNSACGTVNCVANLPESLPDGYYKWHVRALTSVDYGNWSSYWRFSTISLPATPRLRSPGNTATIYGSRPTFKWYPLNDVTSYRLLLETPAGSVIGEWQIGLSSCEGKTYCEFRTPQGLPAFGEFRWKVSSIRSGIEGNWSQTYSFSYEQLAETNQVAPTTNSILQNPTPEFQWNVVTGPTYYQFQIRDLEDNIIVFELTPEDECINSICSYTPATSLSNGDYKWHVRAKNGINYAQWTPYWYFTIDTSMTQEFEFNGSAPGWIDAQTRWSFYNDVYYRGTPGSNTFFSAITYYDQDYSDASFTAQIRSLGTYGADGFSLLLRSQFTDTGAIIRGYTIDVEGTTSGIKISGWRVSTASTLTSPMIDKPTATDIPGIDISLFHIYTLEVIANQATLSIDGQIMYTMPIDPLFSSGKFGFDVISPHPIGHSVDVNWAAIQYH